MENSDGSIGVMEFDPERRTHRTRFATERCPPSLALAEAIAAAKGTDPLALDPLGETVDMEALNTVLDSSDPGTEVTVESNGFRATVGSEGFIELRRIDYDTTRPDAGE